MASKPPSTSTSLKSRRRKDYKWFCTHQTRWSDNDQYSHMNNAIYHHLIDTAVNTYLLTAHVVPSPPSSPTPRPTPLAVNYPPSPLTPTFSPHTSPLINLTVSSHCSYFHPLSFPTSLDLGLRVNHLGRASVEYEVGIFEKGREEVCAVGGFVQVWVERARRRVVSGEGRRWVKVNVDGGDGEVGVEVDVDGGIEVGVRRALERILVDAPGEGWSSGEGSKL